MNDPGRVAQVVKKAPGSVEEDLAASTGTFGPG
jgi:hypothetical protein